MNSSLKNLRIVLDFSIEDVTSLTGLSVDRLREIEERDQPIPASLLRFYADTLSVSESQLSLLYSNDNDRFRLFENAKYICCRILNGYLSFCLWVASFDETSKKVPS